MYVNTFCKNVDEARGVCENRTRWRSVVSTNFHLPFAKRRFTRCSAPIGRSVMLMMMNIFSIQTSSS